MTLFKKSVTVAVVFLVLGAVATIIYYFLYRPFQVPSREPAENASAFERGEFYFSHSSEGVYDLAKARAAYAEAITEGNGSEAIMAEYQLGRIDFLEAKLDSAIVHFERVIEHSKDDLPAAYYMLGLAYAYRAKFNDSATDWREAEAAFLQFLEQVPESPWGRTDLSWIYFAQGKYAAMFPLLTEGIKHNPDSPWLHNMYGLALLNVGRSDEATTHFKTAGELAAKLTPTDWGRAYPGNDPASWDQGLASFRDAIRKNADLAKTQSESD